MIYLDNAASTQIDSRVLDEMMPFLQNEYGNPGSFHSKGASARRAIDTARQRTAEFVGCKPDQIIFTSGGTEANQLAIFGLISHLQSIGKTHIITTEIEHHSVLSVMKILQDRYSFSISYIPPMMNGRIDIMDIEAEIRPATGLVCVMAVNNETGAENPTAEIGRICENNGILFMTDCVQAAGKQKINIDTMHCDFLTISGHKIHGPKGSGALFVKDKSLLDPVILGSRSQEFGLRGGTENTAAIVGLGKACEIIDEEAFEDIRTARNIFLLMLIEESKKKKLFDNLFWNGCGQSVINFGFEGVDGESMLLMLNSESVCVSAGAACNTHESEPSYVLTAMRRTPEEARNSIRVSFSRMNTVGEVSRAAEIITDCASLLRNGGIT
ncbi:MAG: cysteine desulfurase [Bacteroidales bacterium]|nr:cysteine desulfurase [Bacteroidales bacterium]